MTGNVGQSLAAALHDHRNGRLHEAERVYRQILATDPRNADALHLLGVLAHETQRFDLALDLIGQAISVALNISLFHDNLGHVLESLGRLDDAAASYRRAIEQDPAFAEGHQHLGTVLIEQERLDEAAACFRRAIETRPDYREAWNNLAAVLLRQRRMEEAAACYRRLLADSPNDAQAHLSLAEALLALERPEEAIPSYRQALALRPDWAEAFTRLGVAFMRNADPAAALGCFQSAVRLRPNDPDAHVNLAIALLLAGDMAAGWQEYEWRSRLKPVAGARREFGRPLWRGEAATGQTLLIHAEQGFGDMIQFCRYAPLAHARGMRVIVEAPAPLIRLLGTLGGVEALVPRGDKLPRFDWHCPMLSLPLAFGTTLARIPGTTPYLRADPEEAASVAVRLAEEAPDGLRVGIAWAGNPDTEFDQRRSLDPDRLAPLWPVPGVRFVCLQESGFARPASSPLIDLMEGISDFAGTAAVIANLDLVISADTAPVHLAGALGKPVWLLNRFDNCWRWLTGREDSPWYPTLRIFRQPRPGDWDSVLGRVAAALRRAADSYGSSKHALPGGFPGGGGRG
ncbi:MAG TPA: tetratricopeptide repeat protein [Acetobacteraceae bacterium]|nr:tetratricopeptide repeat protein [Acetobacteraceae bacterium]